MNKKLVKVAKHLNNLGLTAYANEITSLIKNAGYSDLSFGIQNDISEEERRVKLAIPGIIEKHINLFKEKFEQKFSRWKMEISFKYEEPERYGIGRGVTYDNGSVSISVIINTEITDDIYATFHDDLESMEEWCRSEAGIRLDFGMSSSVYSLDTDNLPIEGGAALTL